MNIKQQLDKFFDICKELQQALKYEIGLQFLYFRIDGKIIKECNIIKNHSVICALEDLVCIEQCHLNQLDENVIDLLNNLRLSQPFENLLSFVKDIFFINSFYIDEKNINASVNF